LLYPTDPIAPAGMPASQGKRALFRQNLTVTEPVGNSLHRDTASLDHQGTT